MNIDIYVCTHRKTEKKKNWGAMQYNNNVYIIYYKTVPRET